MPLRCVSPKRKATSEKKLTWRSQRNRKGLVWIISLTHQLRCRDVIDLAKLKTKTKTFQSGGRLDLQDQKLGISETQVVIWDEIVENRSLWSECPRRFALMVTYWFLPVTPKEIQNLFSCSSLKEKVWKWVVDEAVVLLQFSPESDGTRWMERGSEYSRSISIPARSIRFAVG